MVKRFHTKNELTQEEFTEKTLNHQSVVGCREGQGTAGTRG